MYEVALEGYGTACAVSLWPPIMAVPGHIQLGQVSPVPSPSMEHTRLVHCCVALGQVHHVHHVGL